MPTIGDVAAKARVSTATVSRALNGKSSVDPELAKRVRAAAAELGYQPHGPARNLRRQETAIIALIISDLESAFFSAIARGVEDIARGGGYSVVLCNSDDDPERERHYIEVALQERVAGVVISPASGAADVHQLIERGTPVVAVDRPLDERGCDRVLVDTRTAAEHATAHLFGQGYRRIGCITGLEGVYTAEQRLAGYRDAHRAAGRVCDPSLVRHADFHAERAEVAAAALLERAEPPDALLVANNRMAIGALRAVEARGLRIGADIGIVAFDDAPWMTLVHPTISVVDQPNYDIGSTASHMVLTRIDDCERPPSSIVFQAHLIERESSRRGS